MNTFDYALLILLALGALSGFQTGLITGLSKFAGKIAAIVIAVVFYPQFLKVIDPVFKLREKIEPQVSGFIAKFVEAQTAGAGQFGYNDTVFQPVINDFTVSFTDYILNIAAFIILFLFASLIINIIISIAIAPVARNLTLINRGGGLAVGMLSAFLILSLLLGLAYPLVTAADPNFWGIADSELYPWFVSGYQLVLSIVSLFAGDILSNPLDSFSFL